MALAAEPLRIATYNAELSANGPGLMLQALQKGNDPAQTAAVAVIVALDADVLLITGIDYDAKGAGLSALEKRLEDAGSPYPYLLALRPNTGVASGLDLDGNGHLGEPRDALAYGRFAGQAGMAVLSRRPILVDQVRNLNSLSWVGLTGNMAPPGTPPTVPLSTAGHWLVPIRLTDSKVLTLLAYYATPPVFDGPEDRNGRRNADESSLWTWLLSGKLAEPPPAPPFVILGQSNLDPVDGEGRPEALLTLLSNPALQDPKPKGAPHLQDKEQSGDPAMDTATYEGIGGLRVEIVLPSADLNVMSSGVLRPIDSDAFTTTLKAASRHYPVWIDISPP